MQLTAPWLMTQTFSMVVDITIGLVIKFGVVIALVPLFSLPAIVSPCCSLVRRPAHRAQVIGGVGAVLGELYIHGQLSVKVGLNALGAQPSSQPNVARDVERQIAAVLAFLRCCQRDRINQGLWSARATACRSQAENGQIYPYSQNCKFAET